MLASSTLGTLFVLRFFRSFPVKKFYINFNFLPLFLIHNWNIFRRLMAPSWKSKGCMKQCNRMHHETITLYNMQEMEAGWPRMTCSHLLEKLSNTQLTNSYPNFQCFNFASFASCGGEALRESFSREGSKCTFTLGLCCGCISTRNGG